MGKAENRQIGKDVVVMDYIAWGNEYLEDAEMLEGRIQRLREQLRGSRDLGISERIAHLTELRDECRIMGQVLRRRGNRREAGLETPRLLH